MSRRDSAMTEVKAGCCRSSTRTSWPMAPVAPVMRILMLCGGWGGGKVLERGDLCSLGQAMNRFVSKVECLRLERLGERWLFRLCM